MQIIRTHAVVREGLLQVVMPDSLNNREVEVNVVIDTDEPVVTDNLPAPRATIGEQSEPTPRKKANLGHLVGSWSDLSEEQKQRVNSQLENLRDSWQRDTF
ncbi:hypothetical protein GCM10023187_00940 [Nibrella viscosa]|uniref:Uncharacterized protein n=1 Tax=Nibrella viscosa TaxID=1084524 RepID=A0ABP8JR17_9BACT